MGFLGFLGLKKEEDQLRKGYRASKQAFRQEAKRQGGLLGFLSDATDLAQKVTGDPFDRALGGAPSGVEGLGRGIAQGIAKTPETFLRSTLGGAVISTPRGLEEKLVGKSKEEADKIIQEEQAKSDKALVPTDPIRKTLYGKDPIETYDKQGRGFSGLVSKDKDINNVLGPLLGMGLAALDTSTGGGGKVAKKGVEQLVEQGTKTVAKEATEQAAKKMTPAQVKAIYDSPEMLDGARAINSMVKEAASALKGIKDEVGGVVVDAANGVRSSSNPQWYRKFYKENGRAPKKGELEDIARNMLETGDKELSGLVDMDLYKSTKDMLNEVKTRILGETKEPIKETLYRGARGQVSKVDKEFKNVLEIPTDQQDVIKQLAEAGNKDAQKLLDEAAGWGGQIQYKQADDVIKQAYRDKYDAIKYNNSQLPEKGVEYHDLTAARGEDFFSKNEATAKAYAQQNRGAKYSFLNEDAPLALPEASPQAILDNQPSVAKAKQEFARRQDKTNLVGEGLQANAEIPFNNKLRPSTKIIKMPGAGEDIADATLKRTKAGNLVPISKLDGVVVPPDVTDIVPVIKANSSMFNNTERRIEYALKDNPEYAQKLKDFVVEPRKEAVTKLVDERIAYKDKLKDTIVDTLGINNKKLRAAVQDFGEKNRSMESLVKEFGEDGAQRVAMADEWFRTEYDNLLGRMNELRAKYGKPEIPRRDDYYTHAQEMSTLDNIIHAEAGGVRDFVQGISNPFAKERKGGKYTSDAIKSFETYLRSALGEIHLTEPVARMESLTDALESKAIELGKQGDLQGMINRMREEAAVLAGRPIGFDKEFLKTKTGKAALKVLEWTRTRVSKNTILGSASSAIMQTAGMPAAMAENGYTNVIKGMMDNLASIAKGVDAEELSPFLRRRYADTGSVIETGLKKAEKIASVPFNIVEKNVTDSIWWSSVARAKKMGLDGDALIKEADRITEKIVAGRAIGEQPVAFESTIGGTLFQYQLEVNNLAKQIRNEWTPKQLAKYAVAAYAFNAAMEQTTGQRPLPDAIEAGKETVDLAREGDIKGAIGRMPAEVLSNVPGGQTIAGLLPEDVRKQYLGKTDVGRYGGNIPVGRVAEAGAKLFTDPAQGASDLITYVGTPFGGRQMKKTLEGVSAANEGASETRAGNVQFQIDKTPGEFVKAALFGKYATKGGKEYTRDALKSLSDTQSERVKQIIASQKDNPDGAEADRVVKTSISFYQGIQRVSKDKTKANEKIKEAVQRGDIEAANRYAQEYNTKLKDSLKKFRKESKSFLDENPAALEMFQEDYDKAFITMSSRNFRRRTSRYQKEQELLKALAGRAQ